MDEIIKNSIQEINNADFGSTISQLFSIGEYVEKGYVASWGSPERQGQLRSLFYKWNNTLVISAITNLISRIKQTPWEIIGENEELVKHFQRVMQKSDNTNGFDMFMSKILQDYFTLDTGAWFEIVGYGDSDKPLKSVVLGLNALDGLRCYATGNPEFPLYYMSHKTGKLSKVHHTRCVRLVDMPSPNPEDNNRGYSALSRALSVTYSQMLLFKRHVTNLDDLPAAGILSINGVSESRLKSYEDRYTDKSQSDIPSVLRNMLVVSGSDPARPISIDYMPFSNLPSGISEDELIKVHVNMLALSLGEDPQEIWPLVSNNIGSGNQSKILHEKGKAKSYGNVITIIERELNFKVLPDGLELLYRPKDMDNDTTSADRGTKWANVANSLITTGVWSPKQAGLFLTRVVPEISNATADWEGLISLPDDDAKPESTSRNGSTDSIELGDDSETQDKSIQSTRIEFELDWEDLLIRAINGEITRTKFGILARAILARHSRDAFNKGLIDGGVMLEDKTEDDTKTIASMITEMSPYVTGLSYEIFKENSVQLTQVLTKVEMWYNKSINPLYLEGLKSANKNGYFGWALGKTTEHCKDCVRFTNGHVHRIRDWYKSGYVPQSGKLECKGFQCDCKFIIASGPARGRF